MSILTQKYPASASLKKRITMSLLMSTFVFAFLFIFRPFGIGDNSNVLALTAGFGATCLAVMLVLNVGVISLFPSFFDEDNWLIWKEIVWVLINISLVGLANAAYTAISFKFDFTLITVAQFELYTLAVSILPLVLSVLINYSIKKERFEKTSNELAKRLKFNSEHKNSKLIKIEGLNDSFDLEVDHFLFAQASDNYVEFYVLNENTVDRKVIRKTLKSTTEDFTEFPFIQKVHRSFVANLDRVAHVSGNAQGLKLHYEGVEHPISVSRNLTESLRTYFASDH